ncbi:uncharacterized protein ces2b isoform X14 [Acanthochromis polyacanthus]|uniref:uncharacterized protein ces2b isoform X14 n=1 Tax=Acanthochromis polyacanthus TaxID=80966 RepID=UPI00223422B5|nr:uncharacterized protein ces2b isoform X14 [Acanthochromis polyacanthus]
MDNASDYGSEDSRFDSWLARLLFFVLGLWNSENLGKGIKRRTQTHEGFYRAVIHTKIAMKLHAKKTVCFLISVLFVGVAAELQAPEVHTKLGSLRGEYVSVKGKETGVHAFLGVPFAKPPIGPSLRLAPPQPVEGWKGVRDATKQPPICIQSNEITVDMFSVFGLTLPYIPDISEDCLYLNIYSPANRAQDAKLPVMVWIHGGGFSTGSVSMYDGSALAAYQDVVVVLIQYRLGLLGFLNTGDEHVSGNFGLLDQIEALRWVQQHVHNFGGNPDLVTIFGESAGAVSVSLLLLSPLSDGLFHRAIAESGTAAMDFIVSSNPLPAMQMVANASGCSIESTEKFADCMRNLDIDTIVAIGENQMFTFHAIVDGHFLTKPVDELLRKHELLTVPFMTGVNNDEGGFILANVFAPPGWTDGLDREQVLNAVSIFSSDPKDTIKRDLMTDEYIGTGEDRVKNRDGMTEMIGDILFNIPVIKVANGHRDAGAAVYLYEYQHPPSFLQKIRPNFVGSDHGDEMFIVLGNCFTTTHVTLIEPGTEEEEQLCRTMMSYWGNFAHTGSPNGDGLAHWPKYGAEEEYLAIGLKEQVVGRALKKDGFVFMTQTLPEKIQRHKEKMEQAPEVHTKLGSLRGEYVSVKGKETGVHAFLGVPFAKPPIGPSLRLAPPQPVEGWKGVRDATKQPPMCIQNAKMILGVVESMGVKFAELPDISEDCLYLNIYTPANRAQDAKLPVMVWIHGGGFSLGSASSGDASALAAYQDVVVVLIQYRLGILGFLSTGDEHVSGNFGMLDQVEALRWVQQHIHNFGGDSDSVTIFGASAGGVSVSLLLLSPLSDGLFHRAIAESGTAAMDLLVSNNPLPAAQMVANASGCSIESTEKIADCMRNLDIDAIVAAGENHIFTFHANVDGHFLTKPVDELLRKHKLLTVPFMTGFNDDEGGFGMTNFFAPPTWIEGLDREQVVNVMSGLYPDPKDAVKRDLMMKEYFGNGEDRMKNREGLTEMIGDVIFNIPAIKVANGHRDAGAAVYLYEYQHPPSFLQNKRPNFVGADHTDEIFAVLGWCFTSAHVKTIEPCTKEEEQLSRTMMSYWGNFARTGSPNGDGLAHWPKYGAEEEYLGIGLKEQVVDRGLKKDRFVFMTQTLPEKIQQHEDNMEKAPEVHTKLGSLRGEYVSVKGKETGVHAFLGVPFAKPPIGPSLRLAPPQPVEGWKGVRDATKQPPMCIQNVKFSLDVVEMSGAKIADVPDISEDCLYLNIYTPANRAQDAKLPVMVWIHGGGFIIGSASVYDGSALAAYQDVVVVLIQYRLGLLGFLSTGDEHVSGNFGLLDQIEALRWVQQHIHNFGGDPDLVTIFGESAGGVSVSLLLLSPLSDGLFHRAIAESGTAAMDLLVSNNPLPVTQMVANASGCSMESTDKFADCIRNLDIDTIVAFGEKNRGFLFHANVDGHFLRKPADELLRKHEFLTVPFMTGVNDDEGGFILPNAFVPPNWIKGLDREQVVNVMPIFYPDPKDAVKRDLMMKEYLGTGEDRVKNREGFTEMIGDVIFNIPAIQVVNAHRDAGAAVYLYEYQHPSSFLQNKRPSFVGTDHTDEIFAVLGWCFTSAHVKTIEPCTKEEEQLSRTMMSYWGNFARTGSPNGDGLAHWPKYGAEEEYLAIGLKEQVVGRALKKDRFVFMTQTLPEKVQQHKENMENAPEVHTKLGSLRGEYVSVKGKETGVHAFLGVPFAKPPIGPSLRLAPPQPVEGWKGVRDATKQPPMCIQNVKMTVDLLEMIEAELADVPDISEDCLYLNIYTPANRAQDAKLPVMVWIHGGGFTIGSASVFDGSALSAYQDVVVVLIQYRLGLLGFLSTGDEHVSGNFGLLDQIEALRWVQQHVHNFGGDPDLVTIFGESAGGVSVSLLLLSPLSDGLFHHAIAESGTAALVMVITDNPLPMTQMVANASGCSMESTEKIGDCMRNLDIDTIVTLAKNEQLRYSISVDGHFLKKPVDELLHNHELLTVPFITGVNDDEGGWILALAFCPPNWTEGVDREHVVNIMSMFSPDPEDAFERDLMIDEYIGTGEDRVKNRDGMTELIGDFIFNIPAIKTANAHRDAGAAVYLYEYQHPPSFLQKKRPSFVGSDHADEIFSVLGFCFTTTHVKITEPCTEEEEQLSRKVMSYWGNFARTGSPNGEGLAHWPKYGAEEEYLGIGLKEQVVGRDLKKDRFVFMTQTLPEKIQQHDANIEHSEL